VLIGQSGPHKVYVTWDQVGSGPTFHRVDWVCQKAKPMGSPVTISDAIWNELAGWAGSAFHFAGPNDTLVRGWELLDGTWYYWKKGDCKCWAECMSLAVDMLGVRPTDSTWVCASATAGAGNCMATDAPLYRRINEDGYQEWLCFVFPDGVINIGEGCCRAAGKFYALKPKARADNDYEMLKTLTTSKGVTQWWCSVYGGRVFGAFSFVPVP